jgi:hypothetical protein
MPRPPFILVLLLVVLFSLATFLQPRQEQIEVTGGGAQRGILAKLLGEGRSLFAGEMFARADAYFHRGNYPSIFEISARREENHMSGATTATEEEQHSEDDHSDHSGHEHVSSRGTCPS